MKRLLIILTVLIVFSACSSVRNVQPTIQSEVSFDFKPGDTIGVFKNNPEDNDFEDFTLWRTLNFKSEDIDNWRNLDVKILLNKDSSIEIQLLDHDSILEQERFKGKVTTDYYLLKNQFKYKTIVIFATYGDRSTKITLTDQNKLLAINQSAGLLLLGGVVPIFGAVPQPTEIIYKRKNTVANKK